MEFPSKAHQEHLRRHLLDHGYGTLTDEQKYHLHAYRYGMRRVLLGQRERVYSADPEGKWFDPGLADDAEQFYRERFRR